MMIWGASRKDDLGEVPKGCLAHYPSCFILKDGEGF